MGIRLPPSIAFAAGGCAATVQLVNDCSSAYGPRIRKQRHEQRISPMAKVLEEKTVDEARAQRNGKSIVRLRLPIGAGEQAAGGDDS